MNMFNIVMKDNKIKSKKMPKISKSNVILVSDTINKKLNLEESFFQSQTSNQIIYYTHSENNVINIIKNKFNNRPVRIYYDMKKKLYVFGDGEHLIHTELLEEMILNTNVYSTKSWDREYGYNEDGGYWLAKYLDAHYLEPNCALFQILPNDNFKLYSRGDGYSRGWFTQIGNLFACCRPNQYEKCRDRVPLLKDHFWSDVEYYLYKKENNIS